jgi:hypothetical protein
MMVFIAGRNPKLDPRFASIATSYMRHGEALGIRWDYAFFQMILETGSLAYKRGDGKPGDVKPSQNNFAGLGATGGGVPGESFSSVDEGVKAHLQHLLMYTGEHIADPVADRTRKVQEWRVLDSWQKGFKRPITFADIAGKWAPGSRGYVSNVKSIGTDFYDDHCGKPDPRPELVVEARGGRAGAQSVARTPQPQKQPQSTANTEPSPGVDLARRAIERAREEGDTTRSALGAKGLAAASVPSVKVITEATAEAAPPAPPVAETNQVVQTAAAAATAKAAPVAGRGGTAVAAAVPPRVPPAAAPVPQSGQATPKCRVWTASYGGQKAVIIRSSADQFTNFTVLDVNEGQEAREVDAYISAYAKGGQKVGDFANSTSALDMAFELCPEG